jgi:hypothetical protein
MALTVRVQLGTVGPSITRVKLQSCNSACAICTDLAGYTDVPVGSFQPSGLVISTVPDGTVSIKAIALDSACSTTSQCLTITSVAPGTTTTTTTTTSTTTTTTTIPSVSYCMGYSLEDCCAAKSDYDTNCAGPPP